VRFAVIGDNGDGSRQEHEVAERMAAVHEQFPFEFVLMLGDNIYGSERPQDFEKKFERPYKALLDDKVEFRASLGNHDDPNQRFYKLFGMNGERYYTYQKGNVRFFALDSNYLDPEQLQWFERELDASGSDWKIAYFHHPPYSNGMHGSETDVRDALEPIFLKHGVNVVFSGHEHFYERLQPQKGIYYFINGSAGKLREGDINRNALTAVAFDSDRAFMIVEVAGKELYFQTISRTGRTVDSGTLVKQEGDAVAAAPVPPKKGVQAPPKKSGRPPAP
jgi:hypothetical protein